MRHSIACPRGHEIALLIAERLARGDANLLLDQIDAVDHLGDGMLHLDARVHLHEVDVVAGGEELERSRIGISDVPARPYRHLVQLRAGRRRKVGSGRLFDQLLMRGLLNRAIALAEVNDLAELHRRELGLRCDADCE